MPVGMIFALLAPYLAQWIGSSGSGGGSAASGPMDPALRRLLIGNAPGEAPTGPGFAMNTDPTLMGLIQLQARQQMRLDPLNADIVSMARQLLPQGMLTGTRPTEPGGGPIPPPPNGPPPGGSIPGPGAPPPPPGPPENPPGTGTGPGEPEPGGPGHPPLPQKRTGLGLDGGLQSLAQALAPRGGQPLPWSDYMDMVPSLRRRFQG